MDALDTNAKEVVLDLLGVSGQVTGYDTCHGTGYQPIPGQLRTELATPVRPE